MESNDIMSVGISDSELSIVSTKEVSPFCIKITASVGPSFFIGVSYLEHIRPDEITPGKIFSSEKVIDLLNAATAYNAEYAAMGYLSRREQSRFQLSIKLQKKGHDKLSIEKALDFLEQRGFLSDSRFAAAWLRNRAISHSEGRSRLTAELISRGISKSIAQTAIDEHFQDKNENEVFQLALAKCKRLGKSPEKTISYLIHSGFSYCYIKKYCKNIDFLD